MIPATRFEDRLSWYTQKSGAQALPCSVPQSPIHSSRNWVPVYQSSYALDGGGLKLTRFLRRPLIISYKRIVRVEVYIREKGEISKDAEMYTKNAAAELRKAGFRFVDYTNDEANIVLLVTGKDVVMISPAKPKSFLKSLKQRAPKLKAKIVELSAQGKTVKELE